MASPEQYALQAIVDHARELHVDEDATWYAVTPGDTQEFGGTESPIGLQLKIGKGPGGTWVLLDVGSYNR